MGPEMHPATQRTATTNQQHNRQGSIVVLAAFMMVVIFAFVALSLDMGYIALTKTQLQAASDAGAHAAGIELAQGFGPISVSSGSIQTLAEQAAVDVAANFKSGTLPSAFVDPNRDIRFGQLEWNDFTGSWEETWGVAPYNLVEVTARRDQAASLNNDAQLPLFFAPIIGHRTAKLAVTAQAALIPGTGFKVPPGSTKTASVVPIAIDEQSWNDLMNRFASDGDTHAYDPTTQTVTNGSDGVLELNIYPGSNPSLPSGNRGTVDFGSANNSTADLSRQIVNGLNAYDLSFFPNNEVNLDEIPMNLNGDTGLSAGIKDELAAIIGQKRAFPIFSNVTGPGNNATYTIIKFVGATIVDVKLTGACKKVIIQPTAYIDNTSIRGTGGTDAAIQNDTVFAPLYLHR